MLRDLKERLNRIQDDPVPEPPKKVVFDSELLADSAGNAVIVDLYEVGVCYDSRSVLVMVSLTVQTRDKLLIVGANGTIRWSPSAKIGYLQQMAVDHADTRTVFEVYRAGRSGFERELLSELVSWRLFMYEETRLEVNTLSLGQVQKLQLAQILAQRPNVLR